MKPIASATGYAMVTPSGVLMPHTFAPTEALAWESIMGQPVPMAFARTRYRCVRVRMAVLDQAQDGPGR